jgi:hypothetical protein
MEWKSRGLLVGLIIIIKMSRAAASTAVSISSHSAINDLLLGSLDPNGTTFCSATPAQRAESGAGTMEARSWDRSAARRSADIAR